MLPVWQHYLRPLRKWLRHRNPCQVVRKVDQEWQLDQEEVMPKPNDELRYIADQYVKYYGDIYNLVPVIQQGHFAVVDKPRAWRIAHEYESLPVDDSKNFSVVDAYEALVDELADQWDHIKFYGYSLLPWEDEGQPYLSSREMRLDVRFNKRLFYFTGGEPHPFLSSVHPETGVIGNEMLRAVHDIFGHAAEGYEFGERGEENAWIHHSMMFSPLAQRALTTETRGQNSWVNSGPYAYLPPEERPFADQKVALLPEWCWNWREALNG
jgi:hypothetical protein